MLTIVGFSLLPMLSVQLLPHGHSNKLYVSYSWTDISPEIIEKEVTSPLEGLLSSVKGLQKITSSSYKGYAYINLSFKEDVNLDAVRFEISSVLRNAHAKLPEGVSRPVVSDKNSSSTEDNQLLVTFAVNGEGSTSGLKQYLQEQVSPTLGLIDGLHHIEISGASPQEWEVSYDKEQLRTLRINALEISKAVQLYGRTDELGGGTWERRSNTISNFKRTTQVSDKKDSFSRLAQSETCEFTDVNDHVEEKHNEENGVLLQRIFTYFSLGLKKDKNKEAITVKNQNGRLIHLNDIARVQLKEQTPKSYFRINGLNTIYLSVYSTKGANQIKVADKVMRTINGLKPALPSNMSIIVSYDASERLKKEIGKIIWRSGLALLILLVFVLLISRNLRYLLVIAISLVANLSIAVVFYYLLHIEIHLYSLAGITVSLGIIIDNTIIMADHIRMHKNKNVFIAILAATLTTLGALSIVFQLKEEQQANLVDFAWVMLVNLVVSLFIALFFIPSLMDKVKLGISSARKRIKRIRKISKLTNIYGKYLKFGLRFKWLMILLVTWLLGLPVYLLPEKLGSEKEEAELNWWQETYNLTLGNSFFVRDIKPTLDKVLGGSLYQFANYLEQIKFDWDNNRTKLTLSVNMPYGSTIHQMNKVFVDLENYLLGFGGIDLFVSRIVSINRSTIEIYFTGKAEKEGFPYELKRLLEGKAIETGGADFGIYGVGRGFSNKLYGDEHNCQIVLNGYNFNQLMTYAHGFKKELLKHKRIKEVFVRTEKNFYGKPRYEFITDVDVAMLKQDGFTMGELYHQLSKLSPTENIIDYWPYQNKLLPVVLRARRNEDAGLWNIKNNVLSNDSSQSLRLKNVSEIRKERVDGMVYKENQQYKIAVTYNFIGPYRLSDKILEKNVKMMNEHLPMGYSAKQRQYGWRWNYEEKSQYGLLAVVILIVYFICAILLESLVQPLAVIAMIPISFIGVFITFSVFKLPFNQGGYASLVLICGLTVNSALYIINDYNVALRLKTTNRTRAYIKAFNHKIVPVLLTILSTVMGLVPFLIESKSQGFWFSLAAGAMGGLLFSVLAVLLYLPLFIGLRGKKTKECK